MKNKFKWVLSKKASLCVQKNFLSKNIDHFSANKDAHKKYAWCAFL